MAVAMATSTEPTLGFCTLEQEVTVEDLALTGELPSWLRGSLLRTGPAKFEVGGANAASYPEGERAGTAGGGAQRMRHWFDGLAMLHRFTIEDGRVSYGNRFLESRSYRAARERGRIVFSEFATDPCRSLFKRVQTLFSPTSTLTDNANVNVARLGERFVAMTEGLLPVQFDPNTLQAAGVRPFRAPGQLSTAHPHLDRASGGMLNYAAKLGIRSSYRFFALHPSPAGADTGAGAGTGARADTSRGTGVATRRVIASLPVREPAYMHSFGLTERWFVLAEFPLVVNPLTLALSGRPYIENYRWKPELGTRFTLVDRATGTITGGFRADPCFAFHHVNAYEDGDEVVVDVCASDDAQLIEDLYLDRLRAGKPISTAALTRFRLRPADRSVSRQRLADTDIELPRINYARCNERPYRYVWGAGSGPSGWFERIVKIDTRDGSTLEWSQDACYPGEPVFVARPEGGAHGASISDDDASAREEDDGVLLSVVLDARAGSSFLLVLDAGDLRELARASAPHHIPFGFHGQFARA